MRENWNADFIAISWDPKIKPRAELESNFPPADRAMPAIVANFEYLDKLDVFIDLEELWFKIKCPISWAKTPWISFIDFDLLIKPVLIKILFDPVTNALY